MKFLILLGILTLSGCMIRPNNHSYISIVCYREDVLYGGLPTTGLSLDCNKKRIIQYKTKVLVPANYTSSSFDQFQEWRKNRDK